VYFCHSNSTRIDHHMKKDISSSLQQDNSRTYDRVFIFLAEDDVDDQELLIEAMTAYDDTVRIQTATNGKRALIDLDSLPEDDLPTLILLDYNLPEVNGGDILKILKDHPRFSKIPKLVWSTSNSPQYKQICLTNGALAYFVKPSEISGIEKLVREMTALIKGT
jgi:CheY-like chemotaxis protein